MTHLSHAFSLMLHSQEMSNVLLLLYSFDRSQGRMLAQINLESSLSDIAMCCHSHC